MANAVSISGFTAAQLRTIRQTVAKDTNDLEFNLFMEACRSYKLDPFRRQISCIVFNKNNPEKRSAPIIVNRDGQRVIAQRCGNYRPASTPPVYEFDESLKSEANPHGIVHAVVELWQSDEKGDWYPVSGIAHWDEFAAAKPTWVTDPETGRKAPIGPVKLELNWQKMPRLMIAKCAEMQALRAGWPDQFGNIYAEEEMSRLEAEATASDEIAELERAERENRIGGPGVLMVFDDAMKLQNVPIGEVADRVMEFVKKADPVEVYNFRIRNEEALRTFWTHNPTDALEVKKAIEGKIEDFDPATAMAAE